MRGAHYSFILPMRFPSFILPESIFHMFLTYFFLVFARNYKSLESSVCKTNRQTKCRHFLCFSSAIIFCKKEKTTRSGDHFSRNFTCIYATAASLYFFLSTRVGIIILLLVPTVFYFFMHATESKSGHVVGIACGAW